MSFSQNTLCSELLERRLLCQHSKEFHQQALLKINKQSLGHWQVKLGDRLIFDLAGLQAIKEAILNYQGSANRLHFKLKLSAQAVRDYYSHNTYLDDKEMVMLPIEANNGFSTNKTETLIIVLDELSTPINYPASLTNKDYNQTPLALLMPYSCEHDLLFANQIAIFSCLNRRIRKSPLTWLKAAFSRRKTSFKKRVSLGWKQISSHANIHPTAVIEGSIIGEGCIIGAHCVIRYSVLGKAVQLYDGAKVEYSVVDDNCWLMHDLVLYRSLLEREVFLIHGPYQFSYFQNNSAAFANIMMDYRPDNKPIRINTPQGVQEYKGRFLGALLQEKARVFGGTLTAPGITIPQAQQITTDINNITTAKALLSKT